MAITSPKQRAILAALALADGSVVSVDTLLEVVWGEDLPGGAIGTLQSYVSRLRRVVGAEAIVLESGGYRLDRRRATTDLARVQALVQAARAVRATDAASAAERLAEALELWRGRPLGDIADNLAVLPDVARLEELQTSLVDELQGARLDAGRAEVALPELEAAAAALPLREPTQVLLMRALRDAGRPVEALRVAERYRRRLVDETGLDPGPEVAALEQAILAGHPPPPPAPGPAPRPAPALPRAGRFIGRRSDLADLRRTIERERLVTLVGPGGVGKTRLAAELLADDLDAPVIVADLGSASADDVVPVVAAAAGLRGVADEPALAEYLAGGRHLLVLDNCEHVADSVRGLLRLLLHQCPALQVLATSRERLALADEQVVHVEPLDADDPRSAAVELFVDRVRRATGVADVDTALAIRICQRLQGLPLAVELAASAAAALGTGAVLERLDGASGPLDLPARGAPGRHESLRAVIAWSYRLLDDDSARLLAALAVFEAGFTVDAVAAVGALVVDDPGLALTRLVDASLVVVDRAAPVARFRLLDAVRRYAAEQTLDRTAVADAHAQFYRRALLDMAARASGPEERLVAAALGRDRENLRGSLRRTALSGDREAIGEAAVALARLLLYRPDAELLHWVRQAADHAQDGRVLGAAARAAFLQGDLDACALLAERAVVELGDGKGDADLAWHSLAVRHLYRGEHLDAVRVWHRVLAENEGAVAHADALGGIALAKLYGGDDAGARDAATHLATMAEALESPTYIAFAGYVRGELLLADDPDASIDVLTEAVTRADDAGADFVVGLAGTALVSALTRTGRHDDAMPWFADLIELWRRSSTWPQQWTTLRLLAELLVARGDLHTAALLIEAADRDPAAPAVTGTDAVRLAGLRDRMERDLRGEWAAVRRTARILPRARVVDRALTSLTGT